MARRAHDSIADTLRRMRKAAVRPRRERRLRIMIASDPERPIRTLVLPRALPTLVSLTGAGLLIATVLLLCGSWRMSTSLGGLERRVRTMMQVADTVALHPLHDNEALASSRRPVLRAPAGEIGHFALESANTGETMDVRINLASGEIEAESYRRLRHLLRCLRTGAETPPDPRLIELLYRISERTHQKIILVSGFRAPMFSTATLSYHTRGMAADIRIPGMTPLMLRDLAFAMGVKGIGYYPVSEFVHVDVRDDQQYWIDYGQNRQDGERSEHDPTHGETEPAPVAQAADAPEPAAPTPTATATATATPTPTPAAAKAEAESEARTQAHVQADDS